MVVLAEVENENEVLSMTLFARGEEEEDQDFSVTLNLFEPGIPADAM